MKIKQSELIKTILPLSVGTIKRAIQYQNFPKPQKIGRTLYFELDEINSWISEQFGYEFKDDKLLTRIQAKKMFQKSDGWVWMQITKNKNIARIKVMDKTLFSYQSIKNELADYLDVA